MIMIAKETGFIIEFTYKNSRKLLNRKYFRCGNAAASSLRWEVARLYKI